MTTETPPRAVDLGAEFEAVHRPRRPWAGKFRKYHGLLNICTHTLHIYIDRQIDGQIQRQIDRLDRLDRWIDRQIGYKDQIDRKIDKQIDRQIQRYTWKQTGVFDMKRNGIILVSPALNKSAGLGISCGCFCDASCDTSSFTRRLSQPARIGALWASPGLNRRDSEHCGPGRTSTGEIQRAVGLAGP